MFKHTLTSTEKQAIVDRELTRAQAHHPDTDAAVTVADETNDNGQPIFSVIRRTVDPWAPSRRRS